MAPEELPATPAQFPFSQLQIAAPPSDNIDMEDAPELTKEEVVIHIVICTTKFYVLMPVKINYCSPQLACFISLSFAFSFPHLPELFVFEQGTTTAWVP